MLTVLLVPSKMRYKASRSLSKTRQLRAVLTAGLSVVLALGVFVGVQIVALALAGKQTVYAYEQTFVVQTSTSLSQQATATQPVQLKADEVIAAVHAWNKKYGNVAGVVITSSETGQVLVSSNADKQFFTASIYKLYVAYLTMQDIDSGKLVATTKILNGQTIQECVYKMIQSSDSPCAEKMLAVLTKSAVNSRLKVLGLTATNLASFQTSAADAALVTQLIGNGTGLQPASAKLLQQAMAEQKYRDGLPNGFKNSTVADKVGFYETGYHDTANVTPQGGKTFTVTVLSEKMGSRPIAELARSLEPLLQKL